FLMQFLQGGSMITIRSFDDLERTKLHLALHNAAHRLFTGIISTFKESYQPEGDGYILIITSDDTDASLANCLGPKWRDAVFEGGSWDPEAGVWHTVILQGNQFTLSVLALDEGLNGGIRKRFHREIAMGA